MNKLKEIDSFNTAYFEDTSSKLEALLERHNRTGRAQNVSFRKLVPWMKVGERATHYIHSYPAKLLPQIAHFFLAAKDLIGEDSTVLDPFSGTGTVALEAILSGRNAYFADVNPLAQLIARVKTQKLDLNELNLAFKKVTDGFKNKQDQSIRIPSVVNLEYWYDRETISSLITIRDQIDQEKNLEIRNFLKVTFSSVCRKVSKADPRLSVPVRKKGDREKHEVLRMFESQYSSNLKRLNDLLVLHQFSAEAYFVGNDARHLKRPTLELNNSGDSLQQDCVDLIITSPPYAGAQKYIRASSLNLGWLDLIDSNHLKTLENASIGREHFPKSSYFDCPITGIVAADKLIKRVYKINPLRSKIVAEYLKEMDEAIQEMVRVLRPGGYLVLVIGNNQVCGMPFKSSEYLTQICISYELDLKLKLIDEIKSRGLMTKRNKTASVITREWVLMFQKI